VASASDQRPKDGWRRGAEEAKRQPSRAESKGARARSALFLFCLRIYSRKIAVVSLMFPLPKAPVVAQDEAKRRFFFPALFCRFLRASDDANRRSAPGRRQGIIRVRGGAERGHGVEMMFENSSEQGRVLFSRVNCRINRLSIPE
jgi:hypothetical protein